ncbi:two component regulator with propeller domain [Ulvibacter antarcticus]|uniref:Two component regulator with propeller domain n=1 Tax=Ulvibacter antarcticus TaxID=442714 RepID=A0A3L9Z4F2_9FLAO|nr:two component regulator with propeller domain [Ulvibacter antarcticus]
MIKYLFSRHIIYSLLILVFYISCNGQVKTKPTDHLKNTDTITIGTPKLVKTQGSGVSHNVHCSLKDTQGNLWFGTTGEGVYRYDGKLFTQFTIGLSTNSVGAILEDKSGNIWFGTDDGLYKFNGKEIVAVPFDKINSRVTILSMMQRENGTLWFGTNKGVYRYKENVFSAFLNNESILNSDSLHLKNTESMLEDKNGNIWFGSYVGEGISFFDGKTLARLKPNVTIKHFGYVRVPSIMEDSAGFIWFGTSDGAFRFDGKELTKIGKKEGINSVYTIVEDKNGNFWFSTESITGQIDYTGGVWRFDGKSFTQFTTKDRLVHNAVFSIVEDNDGNLWFGTRNTGLSKYDGENFTTFSE